MGSPSDKLMAERKMKKKDRSCILEVVAICLL